ncbi:MAG: anaerobic ribonucleoside-triphosphate reductase [Bacillota bacterium]
MASNITVHGGEISQAEIDIYIARATQKFGMEPKAMDLTLDGDEVEIRYDLGKQPFQRIRRITGYLVGTLDRFNDAKQHEEHDRVKHSLQ